jgi:uncharacterized protein HemX
LISQEENPMTEERITTTQMPYGAEHTHTTVITDAPRSSGGGGKWLVLLLILVVAVIGVFAFMQTSGAEVAKDNAVAEAAGEVGDAASAVGDAAKDAADSIAK